MTATRVFIILLVLVAVLFAVTLALAHRNQGSPAAVQETMNKWKAKLNGLGRMNPEDVLCPLRKNAVITIPVGVRQIQATIQTNSGKGVRRLNLVLSGGGPVELKFDPKAGDDRAVTNKIHLQANTTNTLAVFAPGGILTLARPNAAIPAIIEIR